MKRSRDETQREAIEQAALWKFGEGDWELSFEHGRWWLTQPWPENPTWPVRTYVAIDTKDGVDFEEV